MSITYKTNLHVLTLNGHNCFLILCLDLCGKQAHKEMKTVDLEIHTHLQKNLLACTCIAPVLMRSPYLT